MSCCWHVCGRGTLRDKTSSAYLAQVFSKFRWPGNLSFFYGTQLGKCYQKQIPEGLASLIAKCGLKQTVSFPWQLRITKPAPPHHSPANRRHQGIRGSASIHEWWKTLPQGSSTMFSISFNTKGVARPSLKNADMNLMWSGLIALLYSLSLLKDTALLALDSGSPGSATRISVTMAKLNRFSSSAFLIAKMRLEIPSLQRD